MWRWMGGGLCLVGLGLLGLAEQSFPLGQRLERHHQLGRMLLNLTEQLSGQRDKLAQGLLSDDPAETETLLRTARTAALGSVPAAISAAESEARDLYRADETPERDRVRRILEDLARVPNAEQRLAQGIQALLDGVADGSLAARDVAASGRELLSVSEDARQLASHAAQQLQTSLGVAVLLSETAAERGQKKLDWWLASAAVAFVLAAVAVALDARVRRQQTVRLAMHVKDQTEQLNERNQQTAQLQRLAQTERRTSLELALVRLEQRSFTESIRSALLILDEQSELRLANHAARRLFALDDYATGRSLFQLPSLRPIVHGLGGEEAFVNKLLLLGQTLDCPELEYQGQHLALRVTPYFDEAGKLRGAIFVADDITEQVEGRKRLMLSERLAAMGRMSAQVAHEIRNPLSALSLNADLLAEELDPSDGEARQLLRAIVREVERLTGVTDEYLRLARLRAPALQREDLTLLVGELCDFLAEELRQRGVTTELHIDASPAYVWVDTGQARQALLNVLKNALEAMPKGGVISIRLAAEADRYVLSVTDSGQGIAPAALKRIFDPFYTTKEGGTGLGLPITQQIIADHGGEVTCDSREGEGTTVRVRLPIARGRDNDASDELIA